MPTTKSVPFPIDDLDLVASKIGIPLEHWDGNCHAVALAVLSVFPIRKSRVVRGLWTGPIHRRSTFAGRPFTAHSWIELGDGRVLDPTRFAFEALSPRIYLGNADHYDIGGISLRAGQPAPINSALTISLTKSQAKSLAHPIIPVGSKISKEILNWLAYRPAHEFKSYAEALQVIIDLGQEALIPIDLRDYHLQPSFAECRNGTWYDVPVRQALSETAFLHHILSDFCDPETYFHIGNWADESGYGAAEITQALETLRCVRSGRIRDLPTTAADPLASVASEFLGVGNLHAVESAVRIAGETTERLDRVLIALGKRAGMVLSWN